MSSDRPSPSDRHRRLGELIARLHEKDPRDRPESANALAADLERSAIASPIATRPVSPPRRLRRLAGRRPLATVALAASILVAVALAGWWLGRSGTLEVRSVPVATVRVGEEEGRTPWRRELAQGRHAVRIEREGFLPVTETVEVGGGETERLVVYLRPRDPADPVAAAALAEALGLPAPADLGPPPRARAGTAPDGRWDRAVTVLGPSGRVTREGLGVRLELERPVEGARVRIEDPTWSRTLWTAPLPAETGEVRVDPPAGLIERPGTYRLVVSREDDLREIATTFELVEEEGPASRLANLPAEVLDRPEIRLLVAERLLADGLLAEAYEAARAVSDELPDALRPLRLRLAALRGLRAENEAGPLYARLLERYDRVADE